MNVHSQQSSRNQTGDLTLWVFGIAATLLVVWIIVGGRDMGLFLVIALLIAFVVWLSKRVVSAADPWLARLIVLGFAAKLAGATVRYLALVYIFGGGDATGYHTFAAGMAPFVRELDLAAVFDRLGNLSFGTNTTKIAVTFLYTPYIPSMYGGFIELATFSFMGQIGFYTAFRRWVPTDRLKPYALGLFFLPTLLFWPSGVGKDAIMIGALGLAAAGFSATLSSYRLRYLLMGGLSLTLATLVRPHVSMLMLGAVFIAMVFGRGPTAARARTKRLAVTGLIALALLIGAPRAVQLIDLELSAEGFENLIEQQADRTGQGGSQIQGEAVTSPVQFPAAMLRVLFRPLPTEASSMEMLLTSLEGVALLALTVVLAPRMVRRLKRGFRNPWVIVSGVYTVGFIVAFSTVLNLGILARQRAQVLPLYVAFIIALGWRGDDLDGKPTTTAVPDNALEATSVS
jgi:hypothetical protein